MDLTTTEVERMALLTRLELTSAEKERFPRQLKGILQYMNKLQELPTAGVNPTAHVMPLCNVFREDRTKDSLDREMVLANAPDCKDGFFKVPRIIDNDPDS